MTISARVLVGRCAPLLVLASSAHASLTFNPTPPTLNHVGNLVANGSFENSAPAYGTQVPWATGATGGPSIISGWHALGTPSTYATWGSDGIATQGVRGSAPFPDGQSGVYFGNLFTDVSVAPGFQLDGRVTFPTAPVFTPQYGGPCILSQTINTQLSPAAGYQLTFWASGEDAVTSGTWGPGVMGFRMSNVVGGNAIRYLSIPSGAGGLQSRLYGFDFVPLNAALPCTVEFINWGHVTSIGGVGAGFSSELVLDDVIVNAVPTPGAAVLLGMSGILAGRRRRR